MKRILLITVTTSMLFSACGSSKQKCDAYGNNDEHTTIDKKNIV
jgi:hypothetical protein